VERLSKGADVGRAQCMRSTVLEKVKKLGGIALVESVYLEIGS
jgi:hypothetical protein